MGYCGSGTLPLPNTLLHPRLVRRNRRVRHHKSTVVLVDHEMDRRCAVRERERRYHCARGEQGRPLGQASGYARGGYSQIDDHGHNVHGDFRQGRPQRQEPFQEDRNVAARHGEGGYSRSKHQNRRDDAAHRRGPGGIPMRLLIACTTVAFLNPYLHSPALKTPTCRFLTLLTGNRECASANSDGATVGYLRPLIRTIRTPGCNSW